MKKQILISAALISAMVLGTACGAAGNANTSEKPAAESQAAEDTSSVEEAPVEEAEEEAPADEVIDVPADEGTSVSVSALENEMKIEVNYNASTGANWRVYDEEKVEESGEVSYKANDESVGLGGGGIETRTFNATEEGAGSLILKCAQYWEGGQVFGEYLVEYTIDKDLNFQDINVTDITITDSYKLDLLDDTLTLTVDSNNTTGYSWMVNEATNLEVVSNDYEKNEESDAELLGAPGKQVIKFKATETGEADAILVYARGNDEEAAKAYKVKSYVDEENCVTEATLCRVMTAAEC